ncbi:MAG TPA: metallophosphoesterase, partial [Thermoleophilaceae bacterium]|nr:metallophosphoesterase [Thermoleophilaceae bacterium]
MGDEEQQSSRGAKAYAGWEGRRYPPFGAKWEELLARRRRTTWGRFTWISPSPLLASINDKIVKGLDDGMVNDRRARWVAEARKGAGLAGDFTVEQRLDEDELSFLVIGDTGEQDASQYATVAPIQAVGDKTDFAVIASDVIYPAGDVNDYIDGFYLPYEGYRAPIYAIPGNHDWYDGLNGFMFHFCNVPPLAPIKYRAGAYSWRERVARALWRHPSPPEDRDELIQQRSLRAAATGSPGPVQPGPYYAIDTKHLRIVCIDTGITGKLDREQGEWLVRVSKERKCDKVLITGKPIYVNGRYEPGPIDRGAPDDSDARDPLAPFASVDDVVRHPDHRYVAAIGGDVHNYQHYPVRLEQEDRGIEYLVSGGGGAYLGATHPIDRIDIDPGADGVPSGVRSLNEQDVTLYPLRGDSLTRFIVRFAPMLGLALLVALVIVAGTAAAFVLPQSGFGERVGVLAPGSAHDPPLWAVMLAGPATLVGVVVLGMASRRIGGLAPFGYRTFTMIAIAALLVFLTAYAGGEQWPAEWPWIWRMAVSTLLAVVVPAAVLCGYYLLKDWIPAAVRVALACAPALAFGVVLTAGDVDGRLLAIAVLGVLVAVVVLVGAIRGKDHVPLDATPAAAAAAESAGTLAPQRAAVATFLHRLRSPAARRKLRLRAGRLLPRAIAG